MGFFGGVSQSEHDALRERVRRLEATVAALAERQGLSAAELREVEIAGVPPRARELKREGRTIEAIKVVRQETGAGLREAKELVDRI